MIIEDLVLLELIKDPNTPLRPFKDIVDKNGYSIEKIDLGKIVAYLKSKNLVETFDIIGREERLRITNKGIEFITDYKSFSNYLVIKKAEEDRIKRETKRKSKIEIIGIGSSILFGVTSLILGYLTYQDNMELNRKENDIQKLSKGLIQRDKTIDSLNQASADTLNKSNVPRQ